MVPLIFILMRRTSLNRNPKTFTTSSLQRKHGICNHIVWICEFDRNIQKINIFFLQSNTLIQHSYFWSIWWEFTNICILRAQLGVTTSLAVPDAMVAPTSLSLEIAVSISPRRKYNPENQPPNFFQDQFRRFNLPRLHSTTAITKLCAELDRMPKNCCTW